VYIVYNNSAQCNAHTKSRDEKSLTVVIQNSSAVAEMGDRLTITDMGLKVGGCCVPFRGGLGSHLTQHACTKAYVHTK